MPGNISKLVKILSYKIASFTNQATFALQLIDFHKTTYLSSHKAKAYQSDLIVKDNGAWNSVIK